jgi:hypothetical protein
MPSNQFLGSACQSSSTSETQATNHSQFNMGSKNPDDGTTKKTVFGKETHTKDNPKPETRTKLNWTNLLGYILPDFITFDCVCTHVHTVLCVVVFHRILYTVHNVLYAVYCTQHDTKLGWTTTPFSAVICSHPLLDPTS